MLSVDSVLFVLMAINFTEHGESIRAAKFKLLQTPQATLAATLAATYEPTEDATESKENLHLPCLSARA